LLVGHLIHTCSLLTWNINPDIWIARACSIANRNFTVKEWEGLGGGEPYQKVCPELPVDETRINDVFTQAQSAAHEGDKHAAYTQATQWAIEGSDSDLNDSICWDGSLDQFAKEVLPACERAVTLGPDNGWYHDSRGVAQALTGDRPGMFGRISLLIELRKLRAKAITLLAKTSVIAW
jgi:hypothetical protein